MYLIDAQFWSYSSKTSSIQAHKQIPRSDVPLTPSITRASPSNRIETRHNRSLFPEKPRLLVQPVPVSMLLCVLYIKVPYDPCENDANLGKGHATFCQAGHHDQGPDLLLPEAASWAQLKTLDRLQLIVSKGLVLLEPPLRVEAERILEVARVMRYGPVMDRDDILLHL